MEITTPVTSLIGYLTSAEAARRLRTSKPTLRVLVAEGKLHSVRTPLGLLFDPDEVERVRQTWRPSRTRSA